MVVGLLAVSSCFPTGHSTLPSALWHPWGWHDCQQECRLASPRVWIRLISCFWISKFLLLHGSGRNEVLCYDTVPSLELSCLYKGPSSKFKTDISVCVAFFPSRSPWLPNSCSVGARRHFSERWAWGNSESRCILEMPAYKECAPHWASRVWIAGTSPWLCALPGREEKSQRGKYFPLTSPFLWLQSWPLCVSTSKPNLKEETGKNVFSCLTVTDSYGAVLRCRVPKWTID